MSKFIRESWLVVVMGLSFGAMLAAAQMSLSDRIGENENAALNQAIREVVPGTVKTEEVTPEGFDGTVFKCLNESNRPVGWAVQAEGGGFVDKIKLVAGIDVKGESILGVKVIDNKETPGLGNKILGPEWIGQYKDLDTGRKIEVVKGPRNKEANEIQAITGATWSSRYVTDIVNKLAKELKPELGKLH